MDKNEHLKWRMLLVKVEDINLTGIGHAMKNALPSEAVVAKAISTGMKVFGAEVGKASK
jgi:hypothetical protein